MLVPQHIPSDGRKKKHLECLKILASALTPTHLDDNGINGGHVNIWGRVSLLCTLNVVCALWRRRLQKNRKLEAKIMAKEIEKNAAQELYVHSSHIAHDWSRRWDRAGHFAIAWYFSGLHIVKLTHVLVHVLVYPVLSIQLGQIRNAQASKNHTLACLPIRPFAFVHFMRQKCSLVRSVVAVCLVMCWCCFTACRATSDCHAFDIKYLSERRVSVIGKV